MFQFPVKLPPAKMAAVLPVSATHVVLFGSGYLMPKASPPPVVKATLPSL